MDILSKVKENFNNPERVKHDLVSYALTKDEFVTKDCFERHREDFIFFEMMQYHPKLVLDLGCGIGHMVKRFLSQNIECHGIDISSAMIDSAKSLLSQHNLSSENLSCRNIFEHKSNVKFDMLVANGVIWYYQDKRPFIEKMYALLCDGGQAFVVHRNLLFNLFALNQGTIDIFLKFFLSSLNPHEQASVISKLENEIPQLTAPVNREVGGLDKPYDNPFTIHELYEPLGFIVEEIMYTYIHPVPPRFKIAVSEERYGELQRVFAKNWAGAFMGSQFIVRVRKK